MITTTFFIYGFRIELSSNSDELIDKLNRDFSFFKREMQFKKTLTLKLHLQEIPKNIIPANLSAKKQTLNSITYEQKHIRYNDYYGKALSVLDYNSETCKIYSSYAGKIHEISYLLILSRSSKFCDLQGLHKIHAFAVSNDSKNLICMLPMKGGKTTHFVNLIIDNPKLNIISDDSPIVNQKGEILPFPLRVGIDNELLINDLKDIVNENYFYTIQRELYGEKTLIELQGFKNNVDENPKNRKNILVVGIRLSGENSYYKKISQTSMLKHLLTHMIIGIGLPMIIEYFLETSFFDHFRKIKILLKRIKAAFILSSKSENYVLYMGSDIPKNVELIKTLL